MHLYLVCNKRTTNAMDDNDDDGDLNYDQVFQQHRLINFNTGVFVHRLVLVTKPKLVV